MVLSKIRTRLIYTATSLLIMTIYIMRRHEGREAEIASGEMTELQVFLVSGVLDGLVTITLFSVVFWTAVIALRKRGRDTSNGINEKTPDLFR